MAAIDFQIWKSFMKTSCFQLSVTSENESCPAAHFASLVSSWAVDSLREHFFSQSPHIRLKTWNKLAFWPFFSCHPLVWNISGRQGEGESWLSKGLRGGEGSCLDAHLGNGACDSILRLFLLSLQISRKKLNNLKSSLKMCVGLHSANGPTWILGLAK